MNWLAYLNMVNSQLKDGVPQKKGTTLTTTVCSMDVHSEWSSSRRREKSDRQFSTGITHRRESIHRDSTLRFALDDDDDGRQRGKESMAMVHQFKLPIDRLVCRYWATMAAIDANQAVTNQLEPLNWPINSREDSHRHNWPLTAKQSHTVIALLACAHNVL